MRELRIGGHCITANTTYPGQFFVKSGRFDAQEKTMSLSRFLSNSGFGSFSPQLVARILWLVALGFLFMFGEPTSAAGQATIFVNSATSNTGGCSLQEAIYAANLDTSIALDGASNSYVSGCAPGSGADTIVLEAGQTYTFDTIVN